MLKNFYYLYTRHFIQSFFKKLPNSARKYPPMLEQVELLHQSKNFLVINKQFDIIINMDQNGEYSGKRATVADQLKFQCPNLADNSLAHYFRFCHRLDYATSGILCLGLTKEGAAHAFNAFYHKRSSKYYLALVHGHLDTENLTIDEGIGSDSRPEFSHRMCSDKIESCIKPKAAKTHVLVLEKGLYNDKPATKVLLKPITGRRHQLRVHLSNLGHTIVGDYTYSDRQDSEPYRMFLHAFRLILPMPLEHLDISTKDPFEESDPRNKWKSLIKVNALDETVYNKFPE